MESGSSQLRQQIPPGPSGIGEAVQAQGQGSAAASSTPNGNPFAVTMRAWSGLAMATSILDR